MNDFWKEKCKSFLKYKEVEEEEFKHSLTSRHLFINSSTITFNINIYP